MAIVFRTLLLGPSNLGFSETGEDGTTPNLIRDYLRQHGPRFEHELTTAALQVGQRMAPVAVRAVERDDPQAVVIQVGTYAFDEDRVVFAVRRRWPRAFPVALAIADRMRLLSGGGPDGGNGLRGLAFKLPRSLATRLIGAEPRIPLAEVIQWTTEMIDALAKFEDKAITLQVLTNLRSPPLPVVVERVDNFVRALRLHGERRRIPVICRTEYCAEWGVTSEPAPHGVHGGLRTRQADARAAAGFILQAADCQPDLQAVEGEGSPPGATSPVDAPARG
jgi:hypothetical protein